MAISDPQHTRFLQHFGTDTNVKMLSGNCCHFLAIKHCKVELGEDEEEEEEEEEEASRLEEEGVGIDWKKDKEQGKENRGKLI